MKVHGASMLSRFGTIHRSHPCIVFVLKVQSKISNEPTQMRQLSRTIRPCMDFSSKAITYKANLAIVVRVRCRIVFKNLLGLQRMTRFSTKMHVERDICIPIHAPRWANDF